MTVFDAHCDTIQKINDFGGNLRENVYHIDLKRISELKSNYIQVFAVFVDKGSLGRSPYERCVDLIGTYHRQIDENKAMIRHCDSYGAISDSFSENKIAALLSIEGGETLEGDMGNLKLFYDLGVRMMTLSWNYDNEICGGIGRNNSGLTEFGKQVVLEMNNIGMIVDVSHISEKSFWDVAEQSRLPFVASHSNCRNLCGHKRNLTDEQILAIIKSGGCIGINFYSEFLSEGKCTIKDILNHIEHILSLGGEDNISMGSDFDGISKLPEGIGGVEDYFKLYEEMKKVGYADLLIKKIYADNFLNVVKKIMT